MVSITGNDRCFIVFLRKLKVAQAKTHEELTGLIESLVPTRMNRKRLNHTTQQGNVNSRICYKYTSFQISFLQVLKCFIINV